MGTPVVTADGIWLSNLFEPGTVRELTHPPMSEHCFGRSGAQDVGLTGHALNRAWAAGVGPSAKRLVIGGDSMSWEVTGLVGRDAGEGLLEEVHMVVGDDYNAHLFLALCRVHRERSSLARRSDDQSATCSRGRVSTSQPRVTAADFVVQAASKPAARTSSTVDSSWSPNG